MKIDLVIHSSNSNPMYLDFWPLVSKVWSVRFGLRPLLVYIDEDHSIPIDTTYGDVIKMKPIADIPVYLQCLWVRYWIPVLFPEKVCMISDIDMIPISTSYFLDTIAKVPDDMYVHLYTCPDYLPSCYHVAKGRRFKQVLKLHDTWEDSIRMMHDRKVNPKTDYNSKISFLDDKPQWGVDEEYASECVRTHPDRSIFIFVNRTHKRIDRDNWDWTEEDVLADVYADSHSLRPYRDPEHRPKIDRLLDVLLQPRGLKKILHKRT
jgi:hypothetical protein